MAHLITVRNWLRSLLRMIGVLIVGALSLTWYYGYRAEFQDDGELFLLSGVVSGALLLLWLGLLLFYLCARRMLRVGGAEYFISPLVARSVMIGVFCALVCGGGYGYYAYSHQETDAFDLLRLGELDVLEERIQADSGLLHQVNDAGAGLLTVAFENDDVNAVAVLLDLGAPDHVLWSGARNPLVLALNKPGMLGVLLEAGFDPNRCGLDQVPALHYAVVLGKLDSAKLLLDAGASLEMLDRRGRTALFRALDAGALELVEYLISKGANVNATDAQGDSSLHKAVRQKSAEGVALLLERGAHSDVFNRAGFSPLQLAAVNGLADLVELLLETSTHDLCNAKGHNAFDFSMQGKHHDVAVLLLERGYDIDRIKPCGRTALFCALEKKDFRSARFLMEHGADALIPNSEGITALQLMKESGLQNLLVMAGHGELSDAANAERIH